MRVTLVHNPGAGSHGQPDAVELQSLVRACGHELRYQCATDVGWEAVLDEPADLVAVAGGDGTVGRVAKAMVGRACTFTVLPMGTANNISKTFGLTDRPLADLIAGWEQGRFLVFDVGVAEGPWGRRYFLEGFGAGLFACTLPEADRSKTLESLTNGEARVAYALQLLRERLSACPPHPLTVRIDGRDLSGEYLLFEAMNIHYVGPNLYLAPAGDITDGMLDVLMVSTVHRDILAHYLATWQNGMLWPADLPTYRGRRVEFDWNGFELHIDDSVWPGEQDRPSAGPARVTLSVAHRALQFLVSSPAQ